MPAVAVVGPAEAVVCVPLVVALGPPLLMPTLNWSVPRMRPDTTVLTVSLGAMALLLKVQLMLSPAWGARLKLVPVPEGMVVPATPVLVQL